MKHLFSLITAAVLSAELLMAPVAAADHVHRWSDKWTSGETHHWHECLNQGCDLTDDSQKDGYAEHTGEWTVTQAAAERTAGKRYRTCPVCGRFQYEITPAPLPTADTYTLDLRSGMTEVSGDEMDALLNTFRGIPEVHLREMNLMGPLMGYYADLDGDGADDLELALVYRQTGPDEAPNQVSSVRCAPKEGCSLTSFEQPVPETELAARLKIGQPVFGALSIRLGCEEDGLTDIAGHWAESTIAQAVREGWVNGYPDGTFRPQGAVTRSEMTKLLLAAIGLTPDSAAAQWLKDSAIRGDGFTDMAANWLTLQGWTETALAAGLLISGDYADGAFLPNRSITRGEIAVLAARALGLVWPSGQESDAASPFTDRETFSAGQAGYIREIAKAGIINGYPDGSFGPDRTATRAEAVTMVARTLTVMDRGNNSGLPEGERISLLLRSPSLPETAEPIDLSDRCQVTAGIVYAGVNTLAYHIRSLDPANRFVSLTWDPEKQSLTIQVGDQTWIFTAGAAGFTLGGKSLAFPAPVRMWNGELMIPVFDLNAGTSCGLWDIQWDEAARTLVIPAV